MARTAREKENFGTYYILQRSSGCRPLFLNDDDRVYFVNILQTTVNKFNCRIIEYCVQDNNTYHLIIDVNGGDLSKIMKSINIPFGMHAACEGKLFKDRYKSQPIHSDNEMELIREKIRSEIDINGGFSSFCGLEINPNSDCGPSSCIQCISTIDDAIAYIECVASSKYITVDALLKDKDERNELIKTIRRNSTLSLKNIGKIVGGISESSVSKILSR